MLSPEETRATTRPRTTTARYRRPWSVPSLLLLLLLCARAAAFAAAMPTHGVDRTHQRRSAVATVRRRKRDTEIEEYKWTATLTPAIARTETNYVCMESL